VKDDSMLPVLHNGYIIAVDQKQTEKANLDGQIILVHHRDMGPSGIALSNDKRRRGTIS
jgi:phage repressor protein C with HTH and peptisase S24 domain